jgi:hypothetical protein
MLLGEDLLFHLSWRSVLCSKLQGPVDIFLMSLQISVMFLEDLGSNSEGEGL